MGIFSSTTKEFYWKTLNDLQRQINILEDKIVRLEHPPKFKNLQEIYICSYPCGGKPVKQKAVVIRSIFHYGSFEKHTSSPPTYTYEVSIEGFDGTVELSDEDFEPRTK